MWRVNYLLKCFFTLMLNVVKELFRFWFCVESTLPDCIRYDHYKDYGHPDPDSNQHLYEEEMQMQYQEEEEERYLLLLRMNCEEEQRRAAIDKWLKDHPEDSWGDGRKFPWEE